MNNRDNATPEEGDNQTETDSSMSESLEVSPSPEVQRVIDNWQPKKVEPEQRALLPEVLPIVRECVAAVKPINPAMARHFLWATCQMMLWAHEEFGYIEIEEVLNFHNINCFTVVQRDVESDDWRREARSSLRRVARSVNPDGCPQKPPSLGQPKIALPYTSDEEDMFSFVVGNSEASNRASRLAVVAFTLGAGLRGAEVAEVRPGDLEHRDDGRIVVDVRGDWSRRVPVRAAYSDLVRQAVEAADGAKFLRGYGRSAATGVAENLLENRRVTGRRNGLALRRARNTWLAAHLRASTPVAALRILAGQLSAKLLDGLLDHICADMDPEEAVELGVRI